MGRVILRAINETNVEKNLCVHFLSNTSLSMVSSTQSESFHRTSLAVLNMSSHRRKSVWNCPLSDMLLSGHCNMHVLIQAGPEKEAVL